MQPVAEDPNYVTRMNLGLVPALWLGQDKLGSAVAYQTMFGAYPTWKPCGQWWQEKQKVDGFCPRPYSAP